MKMSDIYGVFLSLKKKTPRKWINKLIYNMFNH